MGLDGLTRPPSRSVPIAVQSNLGRRLQAKIEEEIRNTAMSFMDRQADEGAYIRGVGFVSGLRKSLELLEDLERDDN